MFFGCLIINLQVELELKVAAYEKIVTSNEKVIGGQEVRIGELERLLKENKVMKGKWCRAVDEITERFEHEFQEMRLEEEGKKIKM